MSDQQAIPLNANAGISVPVYRGSNSGLHQGSSSLRANIAASENSGVTPDMPSQVPSGYGVPTHSATAPHLNNSPAGYNGQASSPYNGGGNFYGSHPSGPSTYSRSGSFGGYGSGFQPPNDSHNAYASHKGIQGYFSGRFNSPFFVKFQHYTEQVDQYLGKIGAPVKPWVPAIGRFFIIATFFEDGYRIYSQWHSQVHYIWKFRGVPKIITVSYLALNIMLMYAGSIIVVVHKHLVYGVGALVFVVVSQALVYGLAFNLPFFFRNMSIIGGLLMVVSDAFVHNRRALLLPGLPLAEIKDRARYFQLAGRILLIFLFISYVISGDTRSSFFGILGTLFGFLACSLVTIGYKARLSASFLVLLLLWRNFRSNTYWNYESGNPIRDFLRYEHFQILSIIGGLLLVVNGGAGAISVDEKKKIY